MEENALQKITANSTTKSLYDKLINNLDRLGDYNVEVKKTSLHITNKRAFLGIHPRKESLLLNIVTSEPLSNERFKKVEKVSANRYHNETVVQSPDELDDELQAWLEQSYALTVA